MRGLKRRDLLALLAAAPLAASAAGPRRIVCVGGAITETLYALNAQDEIVGVDTTSLFPAAARALPSVGYARTLSAEGVLSLAPTLLLATEEAGPPTVIRQLQAARIDLQVLDSSHSIEGVLARTLRVGELCDRVPAARALHARLQAEWAQATQRVAALKPAQPLRVMFVMGRGLHQLRVAGQQTGADALIGYAGARNALTGFDGYKPLTPEAAVSAAPDVVIATEDGLAAIGGPAQLLNAPGLAQTPAGRAQRVVAIDTLQALGYGPRLPQAVNALAEALYKPRPAT